jgi:hypothetical protein
MLPSKIMLPKIIIQTEEINGDKKVESQKSPSILYEDEFCRVGLVKEFLLSE